PPGKTVRSSSLTTVVASPMRFGRSSSASQCASRAAREASAWGSLPLMPCCRSTVVPSATKTKVPLVQEWSFPCHLRSRRPLRPIAEKRKDRGHGAKSFGDQGCKAYQPRDKAAEGRERLDITPRCRRL